MVLKIPAIRSKMGIWFYYVSSLSFENVAKYVSPIDDELHHSELLSGMIQRSITSNYKSIANYLETQDERFFNSLILAVYNGQPKWNEIRIQDEKGEDNYNLGIITLTDDVKIFPVDGQHRVAGIKKAIEDKPEMKSERVPVIFIGHSTDEIGMQRTRRMFSTLNRYAKPVSLRDIIALDEDDVVAIASRFLIDNTGLFADNRILDSKNKSIPETNDMALTTIITYYECNKELLWLFVKDIDVVGLEEKPVRGRSKINEYIRHRPKNEIIAVIGKNGAGKSTFANCLCGLKKSCKGEIIWGDNHLKRKELLKKTYMVMQDVNHQLFTESVLDEVLLSMNDENICVAEEILTNLNLIHLKEMHPMALSGGEKQRVAIASAIASGKEFLIFDEPTSGLDLKNMMKVSENLVYLQKLGVTSFIITHDFELIMEVCSHILHMEDGKIIDNYKINEEKLENFFLKN